MNQYKDLTPEQVAGYQAEWRRLKERLDWLVEDSWTLLDAQAIHDRRFEINTVYGAIANLARIVEYATANTAAPREP